ncbi:MAG: hypothetical protein B7Z38_01255 [Rhodobacterales bacterium 12-64-8]|nr:MAG: hypothetical protein B7Z38_01255 [Rhodobacterales bacterium 12-64-8]OYX46118.1 MAG: hypothetical protein B7Y90_17055 [Alphaproteobacteria bacterium 32-64-14]
MSQTHPENVDALKASLIAKPHKAFATAFVVLATVLASCASGLGVSDAEGASFGSITRVEEGRVVAVHAADAEAATQGAYTIRLRTGELVSVSQAAGKAIPEGTPVVIQYGANARVIPQNASIGYY